MDDVARLLWVRTDGSAFRVWITPAPAGRGAEIHFADPEWEVVGSAPVDPSAELYRLTEDELEALLGIGLERK